MQIIIVSKSEINLSALGCSNRTIKWNFTVASLFAQLMAQCNLCPQLYRLVSTCLYRCERQILGSDQGHIKVNGGRLGAVVQNPNVLFDRQARVFSYFGLSEVLIVRPRILVRQCQVLHCHNRTRANNDSRILVKSGENQCKGKWSKCCVVYRTKEKNSVLQYR